MGNSVKDRTLEFIRFKGISVKSFEQKCNMSNGYVASIRKGLGGEKLENILRAFPELNREWLLFGEGEMLKGNNNVIQYGSNVNTTGDNNHIEQSALLDKALGEISELRKALVDALQVNQRQAERLLDILQTYGNMSTFGGKADNK